MLLSELKHIPSFALLGPGFGGRPFMLATDLFEVGRDPTIVFAAFEDDHPRLYRGKVSGEPVVFDVAPGVLSVSLACAGHAEAVDRIRAAIAQGDVYQVCYTLRAAIDVPDGARLLASLCRSGIPRFAAWVRLPDGEEFVSASPELLMETRGRWIHCEPMKGTAANGDGAFLRASEKDRAELAMITDLVRNDLAAVCEQRSVSVTCPRREIRLPYAVQTVSDVEGMLEVGKTDLDALSALHPGGSVTGTPKKAALSMIRNLETSPRGAYCGALGLRSGERTVYSLLIRTALKNGSGFIYGVGGGIVYESDAKAERKEIDVKLGAFCCGTHF